MILIGGENLMDLIAQPQQEPGLYLRAVEGGSPYNTALAAARLGAEVGYLTPISTDAMGQRLCAHLEASGGQVLGARVDWARRPAGYCGRVCVVHRFCPGLQVYIF